MALILVLAPASEPVTLGDAKDHLRLIDFPDDDAYIRLLIKAARESAEAFQGRVYVTQTWDLFLDRFPRDSAPVIFLPKPPVTLLTSIKYVESSTGTLTTLASTEFQTDLQSIPARVAPAFDKEWPDTREVFNAVEIRFDSGGAVASVSEKVKMAIKQTVAHWYEHREEIIEKKMHVLPKAGQFLLWEDRNFRGVV